MNCIYIWDDQINCRMSRNKITQNDNVKVCMNRGRKCVCLVCHGTYRYPSIIKLIHHDLSFVISFVVLFKQNFMGLIKYYRILYEILFENVQSKMQYDLLSTNNLFFSFLYSRMTKNIFQTRVTHYFE